MIGQDKIAIPTNNSTQEAWDEAYEDELLEEGDTHHRQDEAEEDESAEEEDDYYGKTQEDEQYRGLISLSYLLPWWDLSANLAFEYTRNYSDIDIYDYTRRTTTGTLTKRF